MPIWKSFESSLPRNRRSCSTFRFKVGISVSPSSFKVHPCSESFLGIKAEVSQAPEKTLVNLILCDLRILDPYKEARYRKVKQR